MITIVNPGQEISLGDGGGWQEIRQYLACSGKQSINYSNKHKI